MLSAIENYKNIRIGIVIELMRMGWFEESVTRYRVLKAGIPFGIFTE